VSCDALVEALAGEDAKCDGEVLLLVCALVLDVLEPWRRSDGDLACFVGQKVYFFKEAVVVLHCGPWLGLCDGFYFLVDEGVELGLGDGCSRHDYVELDVEFDILSEEREVCLKDVFLL
jgi:hypothetical protein